MPANAGEADQQAITQSHTKAHANLGPGFTKWRFAMPVLVQVIFAGSPRELTGPPPINTENRGKSTPRWGGRPNGLEESIDTAYPDVRALRDNTDVVESPNAFADVMPGATPDKPATAV